MTIMNEWGQSISDSHDWIWLEQDGVIQSIQSNDPAITSIVIEEDHFDQDWDWELAGKSIGESTCLKQLKITNLLHSFGSSNDVRLLCRGLIANRSLASVEIGTWCSEEDNDQMLENDLFSNILLPFFQNNISLELISFIFDGNENRARDVSAAIEACSSLKSICFEYWNIGNVDKTIQTICRKRGLQHIHIGGCILSRDSCLAMMDMLCRNDCGVTSLVLSDVKFTNDQDISMIGRGLASNASLKCLKLQCNNNFMSCLLRSLENLPLESIENFIWWFEEEFKVENDALKLADPLLKMPHLKSLCIESEFVETLAWKNIFSTTQSSSYLHELKISSRSLENADTLEQLTSCIAANPSLRILHISNHYGYGTLDRCTFFGSLNTNLEELRFNWSIDDDSFLTALSQYMLSNQKMKTLTFNMAELNTTDGWRCFTSMLASHRGIEDLSIQTTIMSQPGTFDLLVNALRVNFSIKRIWLPVCGMTELHAIADVVQAPDCLLEKLRIEYRSPQNNQLGMIDSHTECAQLTQIIANALQRNTSLKEFILTSHEFDWLQFSSLLCDVASIDATYNSNHTLETLECVGSGVGSGVSNSNCMPIELYSMLQLNKSANKHEIARMKILRNHTLENVNFLPLALPVVLAWVANADITNKLSQMYGIIRKVPHVIHRNQEKCKESSDE